MVYGKLLLLMIVFHVQNRINLHLLKLIVDNYMFPLIEKACAKIFGSYADLISGQTEEGLQLLTGAPCDHIDLNPTNNTLDNDIVMSMMSVKPRQTLRARR